MVYTAHATSIAGREGKTETDDKKISFKLSDPNSDSGVNPEQLFACGYGACFGSSVAAVAKSENIKIDEVKVVSAISLNKSGEKDFFLGAELNIILKGVEDSVAEKLVKQAHTVCPYSKATKGNIIVRLKVNGKEVS